MQFGEERNTRELKAAAKSCAEKEAAIVRLSRLKRRSLICTVGKVARGQDCSQSWLQLVKEESLMPSLLLEGRTQGVFSFT